MICFSINAQSSTLLLWILFAFTTYCSVSELADLWQHQLNKILVFSFFFSFLLFQTKERVKLEALKKKQEQEEERMKKMEEEKKKKQDELKRLTSLYTHWTVY